MIVSNASIGDEQHQLVSTENFQRVFDLTFIELVELRHRGAFSAVAQAFAACCSRAAALQSYNLLENMYRVGRALLLRSQGSDGNLANHGHAQS